VLSALMADPTAWRVVEAPAEPTRRTRGHADVTTGMVAPAYAPEVS
jgi:UDP-3-O-[3-hydroxymyristoyl] N-acetylglucosamine deacetylase